MLTTFCGLDPDPTNYVRDPILQGLYNAGFRTFQDIATFQPSEIANLTDIRGDPITPFVLRCIHISIALYHDVCRYRGKPTVLWTISRAAFDKYRSEVFIQHEPIIPWNNEKHDRALTEWKKVTKPSRTDYKEFRNEATWIRYFERLDQTLESHGLSHLIDPNYKVRNKTLHAEQNKWLYKTFSDCFRTPYTEKIVNRHQRDKDCCKIYTEIKDYLSKAMTTQLNASNLATFLTSDRLASGNHRGTQKSYIIGWYEKARIHGRMVRKNEAFTSAQQVNLLNQAVIGVDNLCNVLTNWRTSNMAARSVSGSTDPHKDISIEEYVALLCDAADVYDASNVKKKSFGSTKVNTHDVFDDDIGDGADYFVNNHDSQMDDKDGGDTSSTEVNQTNIGSSPFQNNSGRDQKNKPKRVMMDRDTWMKLQSQDRTNWNKISEQGKAAILQYSARNPERTIKMTEAALAVNTHNFVFDDDATGDAGNTTATEVSTHDMTISKTVIDRKETSSESVKKGEKPQLSILELAQGSASKQDAERALKGWDIRRVLSASSKAEGTSSTQVSTLEIGMHTWEDEIANIQDIEEESEESESDGESDASRFKSDDSKDEDTAPVRYMQPPYDKVKVPENRILSQSLAMSEQVDIYDFYDAIVDPEDIPKPDKKTKKKKASSERPPDPEDITSNVRPNVSSESRLVTIHDSEVRPRTSESRTLIRASTEQESGTRRRSIDPPDDDVTTGPILPFNENRNSSAGSYNPVPIAPGEYTSTDSLLHDEVARNLSYGTISTIQPSNATYEYPYRMSKDAHNVLMYFGTHVDLKYLRDHHGLPTMSLENRLVEFLWDNPDAFEFLMHADDYSYCYQNTISDDLVEEDDNASYPVEDSSGHVSDLTPDEVKLIEAAKKTSDDAMTKLNAVALTKIATSVDPEASQPATAPDPDGGDWTTVPTRPKGGKKKSTPTDSPAGSDTTTAPQDKSSSGSRAESTITTTPTRNDESKTTQMATTPSSATTPPTSNKGGTNGSPSYASIASGGSKSTTPPITPPQDKKPLIINCVANALS